MNNIPLCVDLDGTLIKNDASVINLLSVLKQNPFTIFKMLWQLRLGKAALKQWLAQRHSIKPHQLPYNQELIDYLKNNKTKYSGIYLVTGSHEIIANAVASHLKIFEDVIATTLKKNVTGNNKAVELIERFGEGQFDYIGNGFIDIPVWQAARKALIVSKNQRLITTLTKLKSIEYVFSP
jgi:phosphoserine phosphatase